MDSNKLNRSRTCIFCGARAGSKEHVLSRWMRHYATTDDFVHRYSAESESVSRTWTSSEPGFVFTGVCNACNTGWMAALERHAVKWFLASVDATPPPLDFVARKRLATWTAKTAIIVGSADQAQDIVRQKQLREAARRLGQQVAPPTDLAVFAGPHKAKGMITSFVCAARLGGQQAWSFGLLVPGVAVVAFWMPQTFQATMGEPMCRFLTPVWPESSHGAVPPWPQTPIPAHHAPLVLELAARCLAHEPMAAV